MSDPINPFASGSNSPLVNNPFLEPNKTNQLSNQQSDNQVVIKSSESKLDEFPVDRALFLESKELEVKVREVLKNGMDSQQVEKALLKLKEIFNF